MYYKKVWIIILIIVIMGGLFPSVLIAKADEDEGGTGDIPGREYTFQDAPFPGRYSYFTQSVWNTFINKADELNHTVIYRIVGFITWYEDGSAETIWEDRPMYFSTDGTTIDEYNIIEDERETTDWKTYHWQHGIYFTDEEHVNLANWGGYNILVPNNYYDNVIYREDWVNNYKYNPNMKAPIDGNYIIEEYYRADLDYDPYQEMPPRYNADPDLNLGMYFIRPSWGEYYNIPYELKTYRDYIEIELQVPREYMPSEGLKETLFDVIGGEQFVRPNIAIQLYSSNTGKIHGSKIAGRNGLWILPNDIKFVKGFYDGSYMYGARFVAKVPIDQQYPPDGGGSTITAMLYVYNSNNSDDIVDYNWRLPEYDTWVKYSYTRGTVDADGDGFDDRTGHPIYQPPNPEDTIKEDKPNRDDYDDGIIGTISFYFDSFIYYIKLPFVFVADLLRSILDWITETVDSWIDDFSLLMARLFSFLPSEILVMLALGFATLMIITIIRAIRGS